VSVSALARELESRRAVQAGMSKTEILRYIEQDREKVRAQGSAPSLSPQL